MRPRSYDMTLEPGKTLLLDHNFQLYDAPPKKKEIGAFKDISLAQCFLHSLVFTAIVKVFMVKRNGRWGKVSLYTRKLTNW